jgi:hypothetical protein
MRGIAFSPKKISKSAGNDAVGLVKIQCLKDRHKLSKPVHVSILKCEFDGQALALPGLRFGPPPCGIVQNTAYEPAAAIDLKVRNGSRMVATDRDSGFRKRNDQWLADCKECCNWAKRRAYREFRAESAAFRQATNASPTASARSPGTRRMDTVISFMRQRAPRGVAE